MFNALRYTKVLEEAGFSEAQAKATMNTIIEVMHNNLATGNDLNLARAKMAHDFESFRLEMSKDFEAFRAEMRNEFENFRVEMRTEMRDELKSIRSEMRELELRMTIKLGSMLVVSHGILFAMLKLF